MSKAPEKCMYCDGNNPDCGFCKMGKPLDTQEDWDKSWGSVRKVAEKFMKGEKYVD